jgi:hypothetical protein
MVFSALVAIFEMISSHRRFTVMRANSFVILAFISVAMLPVANADDGAASIAEGGIVVMTKEPRIVMAKEVLRISESKVVVDYDFRNNTDQDVTTIVAFPIPRYSFALEEIGPEMQGFDDFRLWIDGKPAAYRTECRAYLKGKDVTDLLRSMKVDIGSFGHVDDNHQVHDVDRLSESQRIRLIRAGLVEKDDYAPNWEVQKKYFWNQTFPAHGTVYIRHSYSPVLGALNSIKYGWGSSPSDVESAKELSTFCIQGPLKKTLNQVAESKNRDAWYQYVDFILTTANSWKTPIEDFTLIVERPHFKDTLANYVSFCWDGSVSKLDADHFAVKATDFIPKKELRIGFFHVQTYTPF